jgi:regulation of enolase protein 1 (concanavalin A-like superfamily)
MNLLTGIRPGNLGPFSWEYEPERWEALPGGGLRVYAFAGANIFHDPRGNREDDAAPFLWLPVEGDFVARLRTRPRFESTYDSGCLVVRQDAGHWAKICYESTDFGTRAIVSVVTDGLSDDANGVDLTVPDAWLQIARVGNVFALHYALDGQDWHMVRLFRLDLPATVQVGMVAQCPVGPGSVIDFLEFTLERRTVANPRAGI